jgi:hypothetical protein
MKYVDVIEDFFKEENEKTLHSFFKEVESFFTTKGFVFSKNEKNEKSFEINNIPFRLEDDNSCFRFDIDSMSDQMIKELEDIDEDFEADGFDTFHMLFNYLKSNPLLTSVNLKNIKKTGIFEIQKFNSFCK